MFNLEQSIVIIDWRSRSIIDHNVFSNVMYFPNNGFIDFNNRLFSNFDNRLFSEFDNRF